MGKVAFSVSSSDSPLPAAFYSGEIKSLKIRALTRCGQDREFAANQSPVEKRRYQML
jgi:hypothetical protein